MLDSAIEPSAFELSSMARNGDCMYTSISDAEGCMVAVHTNRLKLGRTGELRKHNRRYTDGSICLVSEMSL
jgi:hypothetical protein